MEPVLALDFDGVICDSLDECLITAYNAYHQLQGRTTWTSDLADIDPVTAERFRRLRHLARNAPDFWLIVHWIHTSDDQLDEPTLSTLRSQNAQILREFEVAFFQLRNQFRSTNMQKWLDLHRMYPEFLDGWDQLKGRLPVHVITTKDLTSIQQFNRHWDLGIPAANIWTRERGLSKGQIAVRIITEASLQPGALFFVDDHPHHLEDVFPTGARCFWAAWGFLGTYGSPPDDWSKFTAISRLADLLPVLQITGLILE